jgi:hypothetical protein
MESFLYEFMSLPLASSPITEDNLIREFTQAISELSSEPEFQREDRIGYATDEPNQPAVKLAAAQVPLSYDLWKDLRNPAGIGLHPAGIRDIWEFYAHKRVSGIDEAGRSTIFQIPTPFETAQGTYKRVIIVSVMLPFSPSLIDEYAQIIVENRRGSSHIYTRMYEEVNSLLESATSRVAISLFDKDMVAIPMVNKTIQSISEGAVPLTHQREAHGPSKGGNFPQKSIAALVGLGQFGVHRIIFRDELAGNAIHRFTGPIRSLVLFDTQEGSEENGTIIALTDKWRTFLMELYDFTRKDPEINQYRFCTHIPLDDAGCEMCTTFCPSGAQGNSMPDMDGTFSPHIEGQQHRFWNGLLQFDYGRCCEERGQMAEIFPEWSCSRGLSICAAKGKKRLFAVQEFYKKRKELTTA